MVSFNSIASFFVVTLSIYLANTVNTQQIFGTLLNQTRGTGTNPQKYSKIRIYNPGTNHSYAPASLFTCICIAPYNFNASLPFADSSNHVSNNIETHNPSYRFKILICPKRNVYCSMWKPYKSLNGTNICTYADEVRGNDKEVRNRKTSCTSLQKVHGMGHHETFSSKNKSEKIDHISPIIKANQAKAIFLVYRNSTLSIKKFPNVLQVETASKNTSFQRGDGFTLETRNLLSTWMKRPRRSTTVSLKPMIFPHINRGLMERKRNENKEINATESSDGMFTNLAETGGGIMLNNDTGHFHHNRNKRETHVLYAKYSKTKKSSRKRRPKPTSPSSTSCDDDKYDNVSSSPYTFLNVSFTGYWEPPERTTVKPRIQQPLKMTDQDRNFVYGDDYQQKNEKSDRGRNNGKSSSGWSSKIKINFRS